MPPLWNCQHDVFLDVTQHYFFHVPPKSACCESRSKETMRHSAEQLVWIPENVMVSRVKTDGLSGLKDIEDTSQSMCSYGLNLFHRNSSKGIPGPVEEARVRPFD